MNKGKHKMFRFICLGTRNFLLLLLHPCRLKISGILIQIPKIQRAFVYFLVNTVRVFIVYKQPILHFPDYQVPKISSKQQMQQGYSESCSLLSEIFA